MSKIENEFNESSIMSKFIYFEITAHGFDGGTDETDDSVLWVRYDTSDTPADAAALIVTYIADHAGAQVTGLPRGQSDVDTDMDFLLPAEAVHLNQALILLRDKNAKRSVDSEPKSVSEQARALVDKVWVSAANNGKTAGAHAIDKLMSYIQKLENNQKV